MVKPYGRKAVVEEINYLVADGWDYQNATRIAKKKARKKFWEHCPDEELPSYLQEDNQCPTS